MLMNEYGSFPQERANWQNVITKDNPVGWAFQKNYINPVNKYSLFIEHFKTNTKQTYDT